MSVTVPCPTCRQLHPAPEGLTGDHYCSIVCFNTGHGLDPPEPPSRHDAVTMTCPICEQTFVPAGRRKFCSDACRAVAYRRRRADTAHPPLDVPRAQPRRPITVYECDTCGTRALGEQRCTDCATFMRRVGIGGACPSCDEPIPVDELLGMEVRP